jgi:hypothetical protein
MRLARWLIPLLCIAAALVGCAPEATTTPTPRPTPGIDPVFLTVTAIYAPSESTRLPAPDGTLDPIAKTATWIVRVATHNASGQATWTFVPLRPTATLDPRTPTQTDDPDFIYLMTNITSWSYDAMEQGTTATPPAPTSTLDPIAQESTRIVGQATGEIETIVAQWTPDNLDPRERWRLRGSENYQMTIVTSAMPQPPVGRDITVEGGVITQNSIIACDNPSNDHPDSLCAPISAYYQSVGNYTIDDLFEMADQCIPRTIAAFADCSVVSSAKFDGTFETAEAMFEVVRACEASLDESDTLCAVHYHPYYGYPRMITFFTPEVYDGFSDITIRHLEIIP